MYKVKSTSGLHKYAGRSKAVVLDNRDPFNRGYIIVDHPVTGPTAWIPYLKNPTIFDVPSIGDVVYVEADCGEGQYPVAWGNITKGAKDDNNTPSEFKRDIPTNRGMKTPGGHKLEMDDGVATVTANPDDKQFTTESRGIRVTSTAGNKIHIVEDSAAGQQFILLQTTNGNFIKLDYKDDKLTVNVLKDKQETVGQNSTEEVSGNKTENIGGNLTIEVVGNCDINCAEASVTASGNANVTAGGNIVMAGSQIQLNGTASGVTTENSHLGVIDLITGVPVTASTTVKADV